MFGFGTPKPAPVATGQAKTKVNVSAGKTVTWLTIAAVTIGAYEGYAKKPYVDTVGTGRPITWCYGATKADGPVPPMNKTFTKDECQQILIKDIPKYDNPIKACLNKDVYDALPPHRHAALVSLAYNVGPGAVCNSSIARNLNAGNVTAACNAFIGYTHAQGRVLQGLVTRRKAERLDCLRND